MIAPTESDLSPLQRDIATLDPGSFTRWRFVEMLGLGISVTNLPVGALLLVGAHVADTITHKQRQSTVPMPDDWLREVAECPQASRKGLAFLAKRLEHQGKVSVRDAVSWAEIEKSEAERLHLTEEKENALTGSGAEALLARAARDCPDLLSTFNVDVALSMARSATRGAASGLASLKERFSR